MNLPTPDQLAALDEAALRDMTARLIERITAQSSELKLRGAKLEKLTFELARLKRLKFGQQSERLNSQQPSLFEESVEEDIAAVESELEVLAPSESKAKAPSKPHAGRNVLPADLPRIEERHEPESCTCEACGGSLHLIGEEITEQLDCEPLQFFVRRHVRPKLACRSCETVTMEPMPAQIIDKGLPGTGLLAQVAIGKYADHLPLYRQEAIFRRSGVELTRATMAGWIGKMGVALTPLVEAMQTDLLQQTVLHADETPVQMLDPGAGKTKRAYLWAYRSGPSSEKKAVIFDFCTNRNGEHPRRFLGEYEGVLMVDDYKGYKALFEKGKVRELGCWAHVRRKFFELHAAGKSVVAWEALEWIRKLYEFEREAKGYDPAERFEHRKMKAVPLLKDFKLWLDALRLKISEGSGMAKAMDYTLRRWPALIRYLENEAYPIDNNPLENNIRPIAIGRKNWLFAGSEPAEKRAAMIMSLIESAKINGHDPHAYLKDILTRLPTQPYSRLHELLPYSWNL